MNNKKKEKKHLKLHGQELFTLWFNKRVDHKYTVTIIFDARATCNVSELNSDIILPAELVMRLNLRFQACVQQVVGRWKLIVVPSLLITAITYTVCYKAPYIVNSASIVQTISPMCRQPMRWRNYPLSAI